MKIVFACVVVAALAVVCVVGKPNESGGSDRKKDVKLSDKPHYDENGKHNPDYDHDAFLGEDEAKKFINLTPEQSKEKLGKLFEKVDKNSNGSLSEDELRDWIDHQQNAVLYKEVDRMFKGHDENADGLIDWDEYNRTTYGGMPLEKLVALEEDNTYDFRKKVNQDKVRWSKADINKDSNLDREEYLAFAFPRERQYMREVAISEAMEEMDADKDGYLSLVEYIKDLWDGQGEEPDWVEGERQAYADYRDMDGDGRMSREEVGEWLMPSKYDPPLSEAKHLMFETDGNKDKQLTMEEVIENFSLFVGSRVTNFGELRHDEF